MDQGAGQEEGLVFMENSGLYELIGLKDEDGQGMEGEACLLSPTSCSSAAYSSVSVASMTQMMLCSNSTLSDSSLSSLCSAPPSTSTITTAGSAFRNTSKKAKMMDGSSRPGAAKVRKEKLGDRITALQQLVSPFGKTDTASVLQEALCYIRFLHDQVQVLSSPYLQDLPSSAKHEGGGGGPRLDDLRSRGLCLVPVTCTEHVARNNGSDYWASAIGSSNDSRFIYKH